MSHNNESLELEREVRRGDQRLVVFSFTILIRTTAHSPVIAHKGPIKMATLAQPSLASQTEAFVAVIKEKVTVCKLLFVACLLLIHTNNPLARHQPLPLPCLQFLSAKMFRLLPKPHYRCSLTASRLLVVVVMCVNFFFATIGGRKGS